MALEKILIVGVSEIIKNLLPVLEHHISSPAWGVKDDLRKLKLALEKIQPAVYVAETNQVNDEADRLWLSRFKDVLYDADDVMDEYSYEIMHRGEEGSQLKDKIRDFVSISSSNPLLFRSWIAGKIRAINKTLDEIHKENERYNRANTTTHGVNVVQSRERSILQTSSSKGGDDSALLGREDAKSEIISMMLNSRSSPSISSSSGYSSRQAKTSVVSIVGMGGLGKTTLAQLIYNDSNLGKYFDSKAWVCVSYYFDISNILIKMIESIDNKTKYGGSSDIDAVGKQVSKRLKGKNFLLVLDDLWNEDAIYWDNLMNLLTRANSITILITTRKLMVASVVGGSIYHLQRLTDYVCWSIMEKIISCRDERVLAIETMVNIGKDIATRCDGLPLAANFLGRRMASNTEESYWTEIKDDIHLWNTGGYDKLLSILKLSYDDLPQPLKRCFSYCSMFPKDWEYDRETLIRLWMAEGFLQHPYSKFDRISIEDIGNVYFERLLSDSFFQDIQKDELGVVLRCKMHDIVHALAIKVVDPDEYAILQSSGENIDASQFRRLQLAFGEGSSITIPEALSKAKKLRTVFALAPKNCLQINSIFSYKRLRVLYQMDLSQSSKICTSIPKLKHLRYLDLSRSKFDFMHDVSLNRSYNLQTLILRSCVNVSVLLHTIKSLKSLIHLDLFDSDIKLLPDSIVGLTNLLTLNLHSCSKFEWLPENIGLLRHLRLLDLSSTAITKLPDSITSLSNLRILEFCHCKYLEALPRDFGALTRLRRLDVSDTKIKELPESCISNLCNLEIVDLGSTCELPKELKNWPKLRHFRHERLSDIMPRGIEKLIYLETLDSYMVRKDAAQVCSGIEELASLDDLQVLHINNLRNVTGGKEDVERANLKDKQQMRELYLNWGDDEDYDFPELLEKEDNDMVLEGLRPHPNLRMLEIHGFSGLNLPKWMGSLSKCLLPNLVELKIIGCNRCEKLPALGMLPCLRDLEIDTMKSVKCLGREFYFQQEEEENSSTQKSRASSSLFPSLIELRIYKMENLEEWVTPWSSFYVDSFPLLEKLCIQDCPKWRSIPNSFPSLKSLEFLRTNGKAVNSILSPSIGGYLTSLTSIVIVQSPELIYFPQGVQLQNNVPNLHSLSIIDCSEFQGFRDDDDLNNNNNNNNNNSLRALELDSCPVLTSLPDLRLWTSLRKLTIRECEKLKESIPYDLKISLSFLDSLNVDFIQSEDQQLPNPDKTQVYKKSRECER